MSKPMPISGFPEWLPGNRIIEQSVLDGIRRTFELHGFAPIETRSVEPLDILLSKGETSKEVYLLRRLQAEAVSGAERGGAWTEERSDEGRRRPGRSAERADDAVSGAERGGAWTEERSDEGRRRPGRSAERASVTAGEAQLGLHFDLTVPFARYVGENAGKLVFPFRRYQIQKVWRGERPQEGRYREFVQADIDIVDRDTLPAHYEAELPLVIGDTFAALPLPPIRIQVNNRKVLEGFYRGLGIADPESVMRAVDKLDKIGPAGVTAELARGGVTEAQAKACLALAQISAADGSFADEVVKLGVSHPLLDEGLAELVAVVEAARAHSPGLCVAELKIARGLDYYTGTVYETQLIGYERFGSVCSGGRYDNLATQGDDRFPGVGLSIGVSRLLGLLFGREALAVSRATPTCVLIALPSEEDRTGAMRTAAALRARGIAVEVSPSAAKFGKQIKYAERRRIPYVWFPGTGQTGDTVKDIRSGVQVDAMASTWEPPSADLFPTISATFNKET